jgi:uncharacterized protein (TIGR03000 family)
MMASGGGGGRGGGGGIGSGGSGGGSQGSGSADDTTQTLQELKKQIAEMKKEQEKFRLDALKMAAERLMNRATEQRIDELRRDIDMLRFGPGAIPQLPMPVPGPRTRELPSPRTGAILLRIPADALLAVNDQVVPASRAFVTPPLEPGREYFYDFEVTLVRDGQNITRVQRVPIRAGAVVRLTYEDMKPSAGWKRTKEAVGAPARITVRLPADARLTVDGVDCPLTSNMRSFDTPVLVPRQEFYYTLKAEVVRDGQPISQTRRVAFRSGQRVTVSFDDLESRRLTAQ